MEKQGKVIEKNQGGQLRIRRVERSSGEYPDRLRDLNRMPKELYVIGSLPRDDRPSEPGCAVPTAGPRPTAMPGSWRRRGFRSSAAWPGAWTAALTGELWRTEGTPGRYWAAEWISVIPGKTGICTRTFPGGEG